MAFLGLSCIFSGLSKSLHSEITETLNSMTKLQLQKNLYKVASPTELNLSF